MGVAGFESITVAGTAIGFTAAQLKPAASATPSDPIIGVTCTLETAQVRWRADGTDPTSSVGHLLEVGQSLEIDGDELGKTKFIRTGGTSGVLRVSYIR